MESKWLFGVDNTGDLEEPASVICVQWLNTGEEVGFGEQGGFQQCIRSTSLSEGGSVTWRVLQTLNWRFELAQGSCEVKALVGYF